MKKQLGGIAGARLAVVGIPDLAPEELDAEPPREGADRLGEGDVVGDEQEPAAAPHEALEDRGLLLGEGGVQRVLPRRAGDHEHAHPLEGGGREGPRERLHPPAVRGEERTEGAVPALERVAVPVTRVDGHARARPAGERRRADVRPELRIRAGSAPAGEEGRRQACRRA
ncbi:MAG: hypothetical protein QM704_22310 [Anaeromyxobacteraceae bacterium]